MPIRSGGAVRRDAAWLADHRSQGDDGYQEEKRVSKKKANKEAKQMTDMECGSSA